MRILFFVLFLFFCVPLTVHAQEIVPISTSSQNNSNLGTIQQGILLDLNAMSLTVSVVSAVSAGGAVVLFAGNFLSMAKGGSFGWGMAGLVGGGLSALVSGFLLFETINSDSHPLVLGGSSLGLGLGAASMAFGLANILKSQEISRKKAYSLLYGNNTGSSKGAIVKRRLLDKETVSLGSFR